jgi:hypothetical protein
MPTGTPDGAQALLDRGARLVTCGGDHVSLVNGLRDSLKAHARLHLPAPVTTE